HAAHSNFTAGAGGPLREAYQEWVKSPSVRLWLEDYALFRAIKKHHDHKCWVNWPAPLKAHDTAALQQARKELATDVDYQEFIQFLFFHQWQRIRAEAANRGIEIIGDAPIYVRFDSADTWANQSEFQLDQAGNPVCVA